MRNSLVRAGAAFFAANAEAGGLLRAGAGPPTALGGCFIAACASDDGHANLEPENPRSLFPSAIQVERTEPTPCSKDGICCQSMSQ